MKTPVGARIGAILNATADTVYLLGYGVYDGEYEPPFGPLGLTKADYDALVADMKAAGEITADAPAWTNPRLTLDDGRVVWGAQCWWGPEDVIRKKIGTRTVVMATL